MQSSLATGKPASPSRSCRIELTTRIGLLAGSQGAEFAGQGRVGGSAGWAGL